MTKRIRLLDHNVERGYGLTVGPGRFKDSLRFQIDGTVGHFTVSATELLAAVKEVRDTTVGKGATSQFLQKQAAGVDNRRLAKPRAAAAKKETVLQVRRSIQRRTTRPERRKSQSRLFTPASSNWTLSEDDVLRRYAPRAAARKLGRALDEVHNRLDELGL